VEFILDIYKAGLNRKGDGRWLLGRAGQSVG
jgi:hypothetical protein